MAPKTIPSKVLAGLEILIALSGTLLSVYLTIQHTRLKTGIQATTSFCSIGSYVDCDAVNVSPYAEIFGIPLGTLGAIYFFTILMIALLSLVDARTNEWFQKCIVWLSLLGLGFDVWLIIAQIALLKNICVLCFLIYGFNLNLLLTSLKLIHDGTWHKTLVEVLKNPSLFTLPKPFPWAAWTIAKISGISFLAVLIMLPYPMMLKTENHAFIQQMSEQYFEGWKTMPPKPLPIDANDSVWGNPKASIQLVEFSDFQCPHCQKAAFFLHTALKRWSNDVYLVFKHYPLDSSCNTSVPNQTHPIACSLARLSVCAAAKGSFWGLHDHLFLKWQDAATATDLNQARSALDGFFTPDELSACLNSDESLQRVTKDIQEGNDLGIRGTPTLFINGKQVGLPITVDNINRLLEIERQ